jgi:phosphoglycerate dehydrogenase-like enzyme
MRGAGVPNDLLATLRPYPTVLTNGSGAFGRPVAEYVVGAILAFYKRLANMSALQARHEWADLTLRELGGRTVGIIGLGDLGATVARLLRPFDVRLLGLRRGGEPSPAVDQVFGPDALLAFLAQLDVLVIAAPLTADTRGLVGEPELAALPRGAFLVNVGRGPIMDEAALVDALRSGHLGGAALEVFSHEPLDPASPLWDLPNVAIAPHCADHTEESNQRALALFLDNLGRFRRGEPLRNVVDVTKGY